MATKQSKGRRETAGREKRSRKGAAETGNCSGSLLADCHDRLALSDSPHCQDYFQQLRFLGVADLEKGKSDAVVGLQGAAPVHVAWADASQLARVLRCGMVHTATEKEDLKTIFAAAEWVANQSWPPLREAGHCRKVPLAQDVELALVLHYRQCWHSKGYVRGELLNSLSLAPGEELKVEFFTWDRQRIERERASDASRETSVTGSVTSRASLEVVRSAQFKVGVGAHGKAGAGLSLDSIDIPVDVSGELGAQFESELAGAVTTTGQTLNEATLTASNGLRVSQKTRVVEVSELGAETRSTRTIRNENRCHTINYDYFEILERWEVTLDVVGVQLVARVPLPEIGEIDAAWLLCNEWPLRRHLLDPLYEEGFAAARLLLSESRFRERVTLPPPTPTPGGGASPAEEDAPVPPDHLGDELRVLLAAIRGAKQSLAGVQFLQSDWEDLFSFNPTRVQRATRKATRIATREFILSVYPGLFDLIDDLHYHRNSSGRELYQRFSIFLQQVQAKGVMNIVARPLKWEAYPVLALGFDDDGLIGALEAASRRVEELRPAVNAQASADIVLPAAGASGTGNGAGGDLLDGHPPTVDELVDQEFGSRALAEARVELDRLICHMTHNRDYYLTMLYLEKGPQGWDEILEASPHARDVVDLRVLTIQDGYALFPLRSREQEVRGRSQLLAMIEALREGIARSATCVTLPTHGTVLESRLGECSACEPFIETHRVHDLELKAEEVKQAREGTRQGDLESQRLEARLSHTPPLLEGKDPSKPPLIHVKVLKPDGSE